MSEHRVPMLGAALRRRVDPARSNDPTVRELVAALATLEVAPAPRPQFRAELRAQLVAVAPRLVAEGEPGAPPPSSPPDGSNRPALEPRRSRGFRFAKPLVAAACVLAVFALLLGGAVLLSRHALPGDALYGVKRASEQTQYDLTGSNVAKGKLKLQFAARRISEVRDLLPAGPATSTSRIDPGTSDLVRDTLASADGDVQAAARLLGTSAVQRKDAGPLQAITTWTPDQLRALAAIAASIPSDALRAHAAYTRQVLITARDRAAALQRDLGCGCLTTAPSDAYGPQPCTAPCVMSTPNQPAGHGVTPPARHASQPAAPPQPHVPTGGAATSQSQPGATRPAAPSTSGPATTGAATGSSPAAGPSPASPSPSIPLLPPVLPTVPGLGNGSGTGQSGSPQPPINVSSCGLSASIGPIGIRIGDC